MFFFRPLFAQTIHPETRFGITLATHWLAAAFTLGWWGILTWVGWRGFIYANIANAQLVRLSERAQVTRDESWEYIALFVAVGLVSLVALFVVTDLALRFCLEVVLWTGSSLWRFAAVRKFAARTIAAVEIRMLKREPRWHIETRYPAPPRGQSVRSVTVMSGRRIGNTALRPFVETDPAEGNPV